MSLSRLALPVFLVGLVGLPVLATAALPDFDASPFSAAVQDDVTSEHNLMSDNMLPALLATDLSKPLDVDFKLASAPRTDRVDAIPFGTALSLYPTTDGSPNGTLPMPIFARTSTDVASVAESRLSSGRTFSVSATVDRLFQAGGDDSVYAGPMFAWRARRNLDVLVGAEAELTPRSGDQRHFQLAFAIGYRF